MEDALRVLARRLDDVLDRCLNPCSNGRCSASILSYDWAPEEIES